MKTQEAKELLKELVAPFLKDSGFMRKGGFSFIRTAENRVERIGFSFFRDRMGKMRFSFGVGIRFREIEQILNPKADAKDDSPTIGLPVHLLEPERIYYDWVLSNDSNLSQLKDEILGKIEKYAFTFFSTYSEIGDVLESLKSTDPRHWFALNPEQRIATMTAIEFIQGRKEAAILRLKQYIECLEERFPKKRIPLNALYDRLRTDLQKDNESS